MIEEQFKGLPSIIWWESVDNYFAATPREKWYQFTYNKSILHITQSMYAKDFLIHQAGISEDRIIEVSDYLGEDFLVRKVNLTASFRKPNILYNPKKGFDFTNKLIRQAPNLYWIPIIQMNSADIASLMSESRVYIDFGNHPGKDRMPREAAISGCCIVTGKNGSANYYEDVPILDCYKFERTEANIPAICSCIEELVNEYDKHITDFEYYRSFIRSEKSKFEKAVNKLLTILLEQNLFKESKKINVQNKEDVICIALYGAEGYSIVAKNLIEKVYNSYLQDLDQNNYKFKVTYFVVEKPSISIQKEIPVIKLEEFIALYKEQKVAALVIPTPAYLGQSFLITDLIQAGVDINDIYCIGRNLLKQDKFTLEEMANFLTPYLDCPYLPYLEYHIVDHCNLNCKACEHYSPLVKEEKFTNYEQFKKDLFRLKFFIKDIGIIRIMGGEPLLNQELKKFILLTRELYPDTAIAVVTNALLLKQMDDELFYLMKMANSYFSISWYPPMKDKKEEIKRFLDKKGVSYWISPLMEEFTIKQNILGNRDQTEQFFQCLQAHCHNLYEGKIAACFLPFVTPYFNKTFDQAIPCDGTVDLYQPDITLCQIKQVLLTPMERCKYCSSPTSVAWEQADKISPKLEDWIL